MNDTNMPNMCAMDGSVGGGSMPMVNSRAVAPKTAPRQLQVNGNNRTLLNTYIYDYFLHYGMFDCACAILNSDSKVNVLKHSRDSSLGNKGGFLGNDLGRGSIDPSLDSNHPEHLPAPNVPNLSPDICFLYEWFCLFWDIFNARTDKGGSSQASHNKPIPNASCSHAQDFPLVPYAPDGTTLKAFYNPGEMGSGDMASGTPGAEASGKSHRTLQECQMQLLSMEQQKKKEFIMTRQDASGLPRNDEAPGGRAPGATEGPAGPNARPFQGVPLQRARPEASSNAAHQMERGSRRMSSTGMGSHLPEISHSQGSPNSINFIANQMGPTLAPHVFNAGVNSMEGNMDAPQMGCGMQPPSSYLGQQFNGQINRQQVVAIQGQRHQQQQTGQSGHLMQWQGDPNGNPMPQATEDHIQGPSRRRSMPPPSAPSKANYNAKSRNTSSSPQTTKAALPTPSRSIKAAPKKKQTKNVKSKKSNSNLNSGTTPAAETAPRPGRPVNPASLAKLGENAGPAQVVPARQSAAPPPIAPTPIAPRPRVDPTQNLSNRVTDMAQDFDSMDVANFPTSGDVLNNFDFDSFILDSAEETGGFNFNTAPLDMGAGAGEIGAD
ncbi:hypothetical protein EDB81DRAFT_702709 [Dactylonectria macrodidyma]|uniref:LisH domain-containing protein n=1 Tax=Dactylonectria macrodidyma TaxID=307937 RepID=A0A9P9IC39_9HYPO|nr:hypothetical protein EDB81DRAFT_702709 [Dactylonectria macrodidyma]